MSDEAQRRIATLPGIQAVGLTTVLPLAGTNGDSSFAIEGRPDDRNIRIPTKKNAKYRPDYFRAIGTPLIRGRFFTEADNADAPLVIIVNQTFARKFWPNEDAVGKRIVMGGMSPDPKWITIVGIVGDIRHAALDVEPKPEMYVPFAQDPYKSMIFAVRGAQDPRNLASAIRSQIQSIDPGLPLANIRTFDAVIAESVAPRRLSVVLLGVFAASRCASRDRRNLRGDVVPGRTTHARDRRAHGLGGATRRCHASGDRPGAKLVAIGTAIGLLMALFSTRALQALLYQVSAVDLPTFFFVTLSSVWSLSPPVICRRNALCAPIR